MPGARQSSHTPKDAESTTMSSADDSLPRFGLAWNIRPCQLIL
jgi:hypothetical protein